MSYRPDADYCNDPGAGPEDSFDYTITDGTEGTVDVTVTCVDDMPAAVGDSATVDEDTGA